MDFSAILIIMFICYLTCLPFIIFFMATIDIMVPNLMSQKLIQSMKSDSWKKQGQKGLQIHENEVKRHTESWITRSKRPSRSCITRSKRHTDSWKTRSKRPTDLWKTRSKRSTYSWKTRSKRPTGFWKTRSKRRLTKCKGTLFFFPILI